jgi:pimeloyl-ACP methyl ester carboxylesterase
MIAGACGLVGWKGLSLMGRATAMPRSLNWAAVALLAGANRRFITLECLRLGFYPVRGYMRLRCKKWDKHEQLKIETNDGNVLGAHLLRANDRGRSDKVVLINSGNSFCYEWVHPEIFNSWKKQGYDVMLYNPAGYGNSTGSRWLQSDLKGVDAVMQYLLHEGYAEGEITVVGTSIGSGSSSEVAQNYDLSHLYLVVPFNDLNSVIKRWLGRPIHWITRTDVAEYFDYNNGEKLRGRDKVTVIEADRDAMMTLGDESSEADKIGQEKLTMKGANHYTAAAFFDHKAVVEQDLSNVGYTLRVLGQSPVFIH